MPWVGFEPTIPASERAKTVHVFITSCTAYVFISFRCIGLYDTVCCTNLPYGVFQRGDSVHVSPRIQPTADVRIRPVTCGSIGNECMLLCNLEEWTWARYDGLGTPGRLEEQDAHADCCRKTNWKEASRKTNVKARTLLQWNLRI
jgi:hypothetical protein